MADNQNVSFLLIGSGRLAKHLAHYFALLKIPLLSWDRQQDPHLLKQKLQSSTHILLAISDKALEGFFNLHLAGLEKTIVHFSGALDFSDMFSVHPLMTFGEELYELEVYKKIHFVLNHKLSLNEILPGLNNSSSYLANKDKPLYHAACVVGGNLTFALHIEALKKLTALNIPPQAAGLYFTRSLENALSGSWQNWSGPIARGDQQTIDKNLSSLRGDNLHDIYLSFLKAYGPHQQEERA